MTLLFFILIALASIILSLFVLIQNPKGGGLSGTFGGLNNQFMGVKQTNDVLEKGTWIFASLIGVLCVVSILFFSNASGGTDNKLLKDLPVTAPASQQSPGASPLTLPSNTNKK